MEDVLNKKIVVGGGDRDMRTWKWGQGLKMEAGNEARNILGDILECGRCVADVWQSSY